ncbi:hypothetical protein OIU79_017464 [Salix purpurea]|uniref:Uncharacterized protein n=1 Tax=Salix purpurea TaxID=77065 RepID=A0A9Q0WX03_SALPP|nr:hypothetical protein OIU79_017464 [Salix purpurea]
MFGTHRYMTYLHISPLEQVADGNQQNLCQL